MIDLGNATLAGLAIIGAVNAVVIFRPQTSSQAKFIISVVVALIVGFLPLAAQGYIMAHLIGALTAAFAASGGYKIAQKLGSK